MASEGTTFIDQSFKNSDLTEGLIAKESSPRKTWFIEREHDKKIIAVNESAASEMVFNPQKVLRNYKWRVIDYRIIGVSDGKTYLKVCREAKLKSAGVEREIKALMATQDRYRTTEEKMTFDDLVDVKDQTPQGEKLRKLKKIIEDLDKEIDAKETVFKSLTGDILKLAFEEELKVARANTAARGIEYPENHNIITPGAGAAERKKIINAMGK